MDPASEPEPSRGPAGESSPGTGRPADDSGYPAAFWIAYVANVAVVTANALTFRFAELVGHLGGRESTAGLIIGVATAAALLSRLYLGQAIDRYGVRRLWVISSVLFVAGGGLLTAAESLSPLLHVARSLFAIGLAGIFTCSNVHVQGLVPAHRRTEAIGSLGSGGFVGMMLGTALGDAIFHAFSGQVRFTALFGVSTLLGVLHVALVLFVTRRDRHVPPAETPAVHRLVARHWPGNVILVAFAMGLMLAVTTVFLTRFATHRGLSGLGPFFVAYAGSAFAFRLASRGWSRTVGRHRMILLGLAGHAAAMLILPFVTTEWMFAVPALFGGFGHALLFPAVISLGSEAFPREYRGTGTTIVMGFFDVGTFVSAPLLGGIIDGFDGTGFTPMFLFAASVAVVVAAVYLLTTARTPDSDLLRSPVPRPELVPVGPPATGRHSPIEPFPREPRPPEPAVPELSVIVPATSAPSGRGAVVVPATRCR
ncbi:MAG TPA: MFS transporter [Planctomycetaceae bacterium]